MTMGTSFQETIVSRGPISEPPWHPTNTTALYGAEGFKGTLSESPIILIGIMV